MFTERFKEALGMMMIGDGVLGVLEPQQHALLWRRGPSFWQAMIGPFVRHTGLTRTLGLVEAALGYWLAVRQTPYWEPELRVKGSSPLAQSQAQLPTGSRSPIECLIFFAVVPA